MKVTVNSSTRVEYPVLKMHQDGAIVLFTKPKVGMVVKSCPHWSGVQPVGHYSKVWGEEYFTCLPIGSQVILEND